MDSNQLSSETQLIKAAPERKRIVAKKSNFNQIPDEILLNPKLNERISSRLPADYNFEVHKTIWRIKSSKCRRVALQFPEGLFLFAIEVADIIEEFAEVDVMIFGDVTFGACCIDDLTADQTSCDLIIHYGHSCLVPVNEMVNGIKVLYVFVDIKIDLWHCINTIRANFNPEIHSLVIAGTIQFVTSIHSVAKELREKHGFNVFVPQSKPLSPGEILGCTAARLPSNVNTIVFVADGRFHLEALMIANPTLDAFKYNPYNKELTREYYQFDKMSSMRLKAIKESTQVCVKEGVFGLILGTLGRQGNPKVLNNLHNTLSKFTKCKTINLLIPEIKPDVLGLFKSVGAWVQIACPRLSIDWGEGFVSKPLLTPYELNVAINSMQDFEKESKKLINEYPMDFYARNSSGNWTPNHSCHDNCLCQK